MHVIKKENYQIRVKNSLDGLGCVCGGHTACRHLYGSASDLPGSSESNTVNCTQNITPAKDGCMAPVPMHPAVLNLTCTSLCTSRGVGYQHSYAYCCTKLVKAPTSERGRGGA